MARTKQCAKRSTGGTSTHFPLNPPGSPPVVPPSSLPEPLPEAPPREPSILSTTPPPSAQPTQVKIKSVRLIVKEPAKSGSRSQGGDHWCSLCNDGGTLLVECSTCWRSNCSACIPGITEIDEDSFKFLNYRCPACHGRRQRFYGLYQGDQPFFPEGMLISETAKSGHGTRINSSPLVIFELILDTLYKEGTPAKALHMHMKAAFASNPTDLKLITCAFDIDPEKTKTHQTRMKRLVKGLNSGNFERIVLIIQTHTDKGHGGLMYRGDGESSTSLSCGISHFFESVISSDLQEYISGRKYSLMVLAACGYFFDFPDAREELRDAVNRFKFCDAFAFSDHGLDPTRLNPFINEFATDILITGHQSAASLPLILSSSSTIRYTGILHLMQTETGVAMKHYQRFDPTSRPSGSRFPQQCSRCRAYRPWRVPSPAKKKCNKSQMFKCKSKKCKGVFEVRRQKGYRPLPKDYAKIYHALI
ncbi:hypothetical protein BJ322DRAFT_1017394 [Thelephora terrestris]|uniref:Uncharacterized protein n=1 Tax=Thelephora terrestris TaxID=56493 RepID=A0A9P6LBI4_9AGAM|nr:hypothetical protein BJ322DRAFT_1017394 [Thelephora terrestris]